MTIARTTASTTQLRAIIERAAALSGVPVSQLVGPCRTAATSRVRFAYYRAARRTTQAPYARIGDALGRDHTTVIHGERRAAHLITVDPAFAEFSRMLEIAA